MSFTYTVSETIDGGMGSRAFAFGTYTSSGGSTGGDVVTGLRTVFNFTIQPKGSAVKATRSKANEAFPLVNSTGAVTIVTSSNEVGQWSCTGY